VLFLQLCVTIYCQKSFPCISVSLYISTAHVSHSLLLYGGGIYFFYTSPYASELQSSQSTPYYCISAICITTMYIQFSSFIFPYVTKDSFDPIFSVLDGLRTSLHLVLIIWHKALNSVSYLPNQKYSSPVFYSSSQDLLPNFPILDFPSATHNNILTTDCNSDLESGVTLSKE
jgi:hypothetical protein